MGWLWWLVAGAAVIGAVVVGARWYEQRRKHLATIAARADQQHAWVLAGDPRGTYGPGGLASLGLADEETL